MTTGRDVVFVQVEVGAISAASDLARAIGIPDNDCLGGLVRFWHHAIRDNRKIKENSHIDSETLEAVTLQCWGRPVPAKHLEIAGFLARDDGGLWRVRGMSRYIESEEKREKMRALASLGGQASAQAKSKRTLKRTVERTLKHSSSVALSDSQAYRQAIGNQDGRRETGDSKNLVVSASPKQTHPLQELWNQWKGDPQPKWVETNATRKRKADARWKERGPDEWKLVIEKIAVSDFCRGVNSRNWVAGPEFLLKPDTATRVLEGEFDSNRKPKAAAHPYNPNAIRMDT